MAVNRWLVVALGTVMVVVYAVTLRAPAMGLYHDDGIYVVTAKSLAEGRGYKILSLPVEIDQTKYPILFPLALSAIWRVAPSFPANVVYLKLLPFIAAIVWLWLVDRFLADRTRRPTLARGIAILTAASPSVVFYSTTLHAETLFAAFAWAGLWILAQCERRPATRSRVIWASLFCAAAYHTRTLGFTLILAGVLALAKEAKFRAAMTFGALSGALMLPWVLWTWRRTTSVPELYNYYTHISYAKWNVLLGFTIPEKLAIVGWNSFFLLAEPARLLGLQSPALWPLFVFVGVLIVIGYGVCIRREIGVVEVFAALYVGTLLLWAWPPARFLVPIYPLLLFYAATGGLELLDRTSRPGHRKALAAMTIVLVGMVAGWGSGTVARDAVAKGRACLGCEEDWEKFLGVVSWLEARTPMSATLIGVQDPLFYLYTGRKSIRAFDPDPVLLHYATEPDREPFGPPDRLAERIAESGADFLVLTQRRESLEDAFLWRQVQALRRAQPGLLEPTVIFGAPDFAIYRIGDPVKR